MSKLAHSSEYMDEIEAEARRDDGDGIETTTGWQPIETAPKDGTRVLLWTVHDIAKHCEDAVAEGYAAAVIGQWIDHNGGGWTWHGLSGVHTHWMPLPPPPQ